MAQYRAEMVWEKMEHDIIYESQMIVLLNVLLSLTGVWSQTFLSKNV